MTIHIIGAGLAGLSAALHLSGSHHPIILYESTDHAGGRCRSWHDNALDHILDNGTHMLAGANHSVFAFLKKTNSLDQLVVGPETFTLFDLNKKKNYQSPDRATLFSILGSLWSLGLCRKDDTVQSIFQNSKVYNRFWEPLTIAIMNTDATHASAYTFRNVIKRTLWSGKKASRPYFVKESLSETFVSPTLDFLRDHSVEIKFNHSLRDIKITDEKVKTLSFDKLIHNLSEEDSVILACPYHITQKILVDLPELKTSPIINIHFKLSSPLSNFPHGSVLGILGGLSQWIFRHHDLLSVTISAAENFLSLSADEIATRCWNEICQALNLEEPIPSFRVIKEKKATLYHSPDVEILRPNSPYNQNLFLAGDWTATSLPCTIEGALYSGEIAASHILKKLKFNQDSLVQN